MNKSALIVMVALLSPSLSFASEAPPLTDEELSDVVSAVIELKGKCASKKETECKNADAVMKMFRYVVKGENSPHKDHMKKYGSLFLEAFADGYINAKAAESSSN